MNWTHAGGNSFGKCREMSSDFQSGRRAARLFSTLTVRSPGLNPATEQGGNIAPTVRDSDNLYVRLPWAINDQIGSNRPEQHRVCGEVFA